MTVDEASAKGIDADTLPNANGPTDAVSPAATKPSGSGVAALDEKLQNLRMDDSPSNSRNVSSV